MVREFDAMSYLECMSYIKEDLGNVITSFYSLKSFHLKRGLYFSCVVPGAELGLVSRSFKEANFSSK